MRLSLLRQVRLAIARLRFDGSFPFRTRTFEPETVPIDGNTNRVRKEVDGSIDPNRHPGPRGPISSARRTSWVGRGPGKLGMWRRTERLPRRKGTGPGASETRHVAHGPRLSIRRFRPRASEDVPRGGLGRTHGVADTVGGTMDETTLVRVPGSSRCLLYHCNQVMGDN